MTVYIITDTLKGATDYARNLGHHPAAVKHLTQAHQLLPTYRADIHVLPEARDLRNYQDLIRAAQRRQATLLYAEEA